MNILFVHQNFPAQFKFLAPKLAALGHNVKALILRKEAPHAWEGVELVKYGLTRNTSTQIHPWVMDFETKIIRADACFHAAVALRKGGFHPDVIISHHGWGESLFLRDVWPNASMGIYCEFFYNAKGADTDFDAEFAQPHDTDVCRLRLKNLTNLLHFEIAKAGISPTQWQASTFPEPFRSKISVIHDGINTNHLVPNPSASAVLPSGLKFTRADEVITYVARNLEPYRGYHTFMRALPGILKSRPRAHIVLVGADGVSYGVAPASGKSWKDIFFNEVRSQISKRDLERVHFLGQIQYDGFVALLQLSTVHVYLTYPFVLSWSLLEAMSLGCAIVASDTQPLHEAITHDETGLLVDFFDHENLARVVSSLAADAPRRTRLSEHARQFAIAHYDLNSVCLPRQLQWVNALAS